MTHFGIICPAATGHLNPMAALGYELQQRGHRVTVFAPPDAQSKVVAAGLDFHVIGESEFPIGTMKQVLTELGKLSGLAALQYTITWVTRVAAVLLNDSPEALKQVGVEALIIDQVSPGGSSVADLLGLPYISVACALLINQDEGVPPFFTTWPYSPAWSSYLRNRLGYSLFNRLRRPSREVVNEYRQKWNLPPHLHPNDPFSQLAQLSQQPAEFEFPRTKLPKAFHFTGPYNIPASRESVPFPFEKLTGQPLIYASMGTVQNQLLGIFRTIAEACVGLDAQLVISLGGSAEPEALPNLPGSPLVVKYAPQLEILPKATLTITHAGLNTTLESLSNGVPMVAIPITNDQPGVAARIAWTGTGEFVALKSLTVSKLHAAIKQVLTQDSYKQNATRLQAAISKAGGVKKAADIIEQAISTGKPVLS